MKHTRESETLWGRVKQSPYTKRARWWYPTPEVARELMPSLRVAGLYEIMGPHFKPDVFYIGGRPYVRKHE